MLTRRDDGVARLLEVLASACPSGEVGLIGSLAGPERADAFSDIDLRWQVAPEEAPRCLRLLRPTLTGVAPVESLRVDPDPRVDWRLVFVRFRDWPLWWRVDLEIHAPGIAAVGIPDADPWSPYESACMGVVTVLKALARHDGATAEDLMRQSLRRVDAADVAGDWPRRIGALLDRIAGDSPATAALVSRTRQLSRQVLGR